MKTLLLAALLCLGGCQINVYKFVIVQNNAPMTYTDINGQWASDTSTDAKPHLEATVPLIP